jgi:hypothetical protein
MPVFKSEIEKSLGCAINSPIFPVAAQIKALYLAGTSIPDLIVKFKEHGLSKTIITNYITRNNFFQPEQEIEPPSCVMSSSTHVVWTREGDAPGCDAISGPGASIDIGLGAHEETVGGHINFQGSDHSVAEKILAKHRETLAEAAALTLKVFDKIVLADASASKTLSEKEDLIYAGAKTILEQSGGCWFHVGPEPDSMADQLFCALPVEEGQKFCEIHREVAVRKRQG